MACDSSSEAGDETIPLVLGAGADPTIGDDVGSVPLRIARGQGAEHMQVSIYTSQSNAIF
jgi:hypothetical protein